MIPCKSTAQDVSFQWSHHKISFTYWKVRTALHVCIIDSGSEKHGQNSIDLSNKKVKFPNLTTKWVFNRRNGVSTQRTTEGWIE